MNKKKSRLIENIGDPSGEATFRGGPFGFGGNQQLIVQNPATRDLQDTEEAEKEDNYEQEKWGLGKHQMSRLPPFENPVAVTKSPMPDSIKEIIRFLVEREISDMFYRDLPGYPPRPNTLVDPQKFVPTPDDPAELDPFSGEPIEKLGPTVFGKELQSEELNVWSSTNPGIRGYNNMQINSLARPAIFVDPKQTLDSEEPVNPVGGMGAVGWPRKYVPDDYEQRMNQYDDETMGDDPVQVDPLGTRRLQMAQVTEKRNKGALRNKINPLTLTSLMEMEGEEEETDGFFDTNIERVRMALQYEEPEDVLERLISAGISKEKAFLLIAAARVLDRRETLAEIAKTDIDDICFAGGSTHVLKTCKIDNKNFFLKFSEESLFRSATDPNLQIGVEYLSYRIYGLYAGVQVPETIYVVSDKLKRKIGLATSAVQGVSGGRISAGKLGKLMSAGIFVDIFLANWDVVNQENAIVSDEDVVTRIDPGGALTFRAQGERKGTKFGPEASELKTMLDPNFGGAGIMFNKADLKLAAKTFLGVTWESINSAIKQAAVEVAKEMKDAGISIKPWQSEVSGIVAILKKRHSVIAEHCKFVLSNARLEPQTTLEEESTTMVYPKSNDGKNNMTGDLDADGKGPDAAAEDFEKSHDKIFDDPRLVSEGSEMLPYSDEEMIGKRIKDNHIRAGEKGTIIKIVRGKKGVGPESIWVKVKWDDGTVGPSRWRDVSLLPPEEGTSVPLTEAQRRNRQKRQEVMNFIEKRRKMLLQQQRLMSNKEGVGQKP